MKIDEANRKTEATRKQRFRRNENSKNMKLEEIDCRRMEQLIKMNLKEEIVESEANK